MVRGHQVVGLVPAAGHSRRLAPLPCSKELLPVGFGPIAGVQGDRPKVASQYLLEALQHAGVEQAYLVIRQGKWDIPGYWGDGKRIEMLLAYLVIDDSKGPPDTIDKAYPYVKDKIVAFGFPDILIQPIDVFDSLLDRLGRGRADVVLGLFPAHDPHAMDMIEIDGRNRVRSLQLKPKKTTLRNAWVCAVWTPTFSKYLHQFLLAIHAHRKKSLVGNRKIDPQGDLPVGAVLQAAIREGIIVEGVSFPNGGYLDIGTPEALEQASTFYR